MFIVSVHYTSPLEVIDAHLDAHVDFLKQEYARGSFIASGRKVPRTGGVILSNVKSKADLEAILVNDPFQIAGIATYDITEFTPSMVAEGFEKLQGT